MTRPPARTVTRASVGSIVIGWSGPGTSTFFSVIPVPNVRDAALIPSVRGRVQLGLLGLHLGTALGLPLPVPDLRHVLAVRADVDTVLDQLVLQGLPRPPGRAPES